MPALAQPDVLRLAIPRFDPPPELLTALRIARFPVIPFPNGWRGTGQIELAERGFQVAPLLGRSELCLDRHLPGFAGRKVEGG